MTPDAAAQLAILAVPLTEIVALATGGEKKVLARARFLRFRWAGVLGASAICGCSPRARSQSPGSGASRRPALRQSRTDRYSSPPAGFESLAAFNWALAEPFGR